MIRATELVGRPVIAVHGLEVFGRIDTIVLDTEGRRVAAFVVAHASDAIGDRAQTLLPAASVRAIWRDTVRVASTAPVSNVQAFDRLPRVSDILWRKVITGDGRLLGIVDDVLISGVDGLIVGYSLAASSRLDGIFRLSSGRETYLQPTVALRPGCSLIIAAEDALAEWPED